jgi:hypothetical protein
MRGFCVLVVLFAAYLLGVWAVASDYGLWIGIFAGLYIGGYYW